MKIYMNFDMIFCNAALKEMGFVKSAIQIHLLDYTI